MANRLRRRRDGLDMDIERPKSKQPIPPNAKLVHKGVIFDVYQWEQEMYDGTKKTFERLRRPDTVVIIPILPSGKVLIADEEQPGAEGRFFGPPGGRVDPGEDVKTAARRELLEETGYEAEEMNLWYAKQVTGKIDWVVWYFIAKGVKKVSEPHLDSGEKINLTEITFDEFMKEALNPSRRFSEAEVAMRLMEAKLDPAKMEEIRRLFAPK